MWGGIRVNENGRERYGIELVQLLADLDVLSLDRTVRLNWIGCVSRMGSTRQVSQVFNDNPRGRRLRGRPKNRCWNCLQTDSNKCKIKNWEERSKIKANWEKGIKEGKVIGL